MRICHIITGLELGGAETLLVNCCNLLVDKHDVCVIYLKEPNKVGHLFDKRVGLKKIDLNRQTATEIRRFIAQWQPDVVHTHLGHADWFGLWACRGFKGRVFCTMHNVSFKKDFRDFFIFKIYSFLFNFWLKDCQVVCISKAVKDHVSKALGVPSKRVHLLYNAIPPFHQALNKAQARTKLEIEQEKLILLFVGRLEKQKAVHLLIQALPIVKREISDLECIIIGTGSKRESLLELAKDLEVADNVRFVGNSFEVPTYLSAADIFVLPSIFEGLGIVLLEAFRSGLPAIASNIEGPRELISPGVNGLLFQSGHVSDLASNILRLYKDKNLYKKISEESRKQFEGKYDIRGYVTKLEELYEER